MLHKLFYQDRFHNFFIFKSKLILYVFVKLIHSTLNLPGIFLINKIFSTSL